jgi:hypothetical protein
MTQRGRIVHSATILSFVQLVREGVGESPRVVAQHQSRTKHEEDQQAEKRAGDQQRDPELASVKRSIGEAAEVAPPIRTQAHSASRQ